MDLIIDELGAYAKVERTSSGGWIVPATLTRSGIFTYVEGGKVIKVLRPHAEVFSDESLATLARCPVTVYHPTEREVTPANYRRVNVGFVEEPKKVGGTFVAGRLVIQDGETGARIDTKELCEVSAGYRAEFARNPDGSFVSGMYEGQPFDRMQVKIRYNHVSIGPKDWGRAGGDVGIHLDGDYIRGMANVFASQIFNDEAAAPAVITIDSLTAELAKANARADKAEGRAEVLSSELTAARAAPAAPAAPDPKAVAARSALVIDAKTLVPELVCDGLSDEQVRTAAVKATGAVVEGKPQAFIDGKFETLVETRKTAIASRTQAAAVLQSQETTVVTDDQGTDRVTAARNEMIKANQAASAK